MTVILDEKGLLERVPLHKSTITRLEKDGRFPKRIQLSPRRVGWVEQDVEDWLQEVRRQSAGETPLAPSDVA